MQSAESAKSPDDGHSDSLTSSVVETPPPPSPPESAGASLLVLSAAVVLPVLWGIFIHRLFQAIRRRQKKQSDYDEFPDYQI